MLHSIILAVMTELVRQYNRAGITAEYRKACRDAIQALHDVKRFL